MSQELQTSLTGYTRLRSTSLQGAASPLRDMSPGSSGQQQQQPDSTFCCVSACWTKICGFWNHEDSQSPRDAPLEPQYQAPIVPSPLRRTPPPEEQPLEESRLLPKWTEQSAPVREETNAGAASRSSPAQTNTQGGTPTASLGLVSATPSQTSKTHHRHTSSGGEFVKQLSGLGGRTTPPLSARHHRAPSTASDGKSGLGNAARVAVLDDSDDHFCSTCLEPYTEENPKTFTECGHHYHLPCLYEWLERKDTCPMCEAPLNFPGLD